MALPGDHQWRKGNPNWKKGASANPKGKPKGYFAKANASTHRILRDKRRNPVEELINIADKAVLLAKESSDLELAHEIWARIHEETTAHSAAIERVEKVAAASKDLVIDLESLDEEEQPGKTDTRTTSASNKTSVAAGEPALPAEANSAGDLRRDNGLSGADIRNQLLAETGEDNDNGDGGAGDGATNTEHPDPLRSPAAERPEEVSAPNLQHAASRVPGGAAPGMETV